MSEQPSRAHRSKDSSLTSDKDKNNSSLYGDQSDQPFAAPAFNNCEEDGNRAGNHHNHNHNNNNDDDEDMPSNLINSRCNVPGMSPQDLLAAHRRSLAALVGNEDRELDLHSLTLSRHQVEPEDVCKADLSDMPDEAYQECLRSFKFGHNEDSDEAGEHCGSIHANS